MQIHVRQEFQESRNFKHTPYLRLNKSQILRVMMNMDSD